MVQDGPQCGLVAICMASQVLCSSTLPISQVDSAAKQLGYTKQGEMFSAANMCELAISVLGCKGKVFTPSKDDIVQELLEGRLLLLPYDKYYNNEPCLRKGQRAHWCLLSGLIFMVPSRKMPKVLTDASTRDSEQSWLHHVNRDSLGECCDTLHIISGCDMIFVYANQGKSIRPHTWCLDDLLASNRQLTELDPEIAKDIDQYHVPPEGIARGLCGHTVALWRG